MGKIVVFLLPWLLFLVFAMSMRVSGSGGCGGCSGNNVTIPATAAATTRSYVLHLTSFFFSSGKKICTNHVCRLFFE